MQAVFDQFCLLKQYCEDYDRGFCVIAKPISTSLRLLFNETRNSKSLLQQMHRRDCKWLNTSHGLHLDNQVSECSLMLIEVKNGIGARYKPKCNSEYKMDDYRMTRFVDWFNEPVVLDSQESIFSRREMILNMADTDGGAHLDPEIQANYLNIKRPIFIERIQFCFGPDGTPMNAMGNIPEICMRQIAFEVLYTLGKEFNF